MLKQVARWIKKKYLRKKCIFDENSFINLHTIFEGNNRIGNGSHLINAKMGYGSYISDSCYLNSISIGRYCCIGPNVHTALGRHPTRNFVSIHPCFFSTNPIVGTSCVEKQKYEEMKESSEKGYAVKIGNDVWIGASVTILDGVTIGNGAIVAAGAVVVSDVADYAIVGGVPAKLIRWRFTKDEVEYLNALKWWDKSTVWIKNHSELFADISLMREELEIIDE